MMSSVFIEHLVETKPEPGAQRGFYWTMTSLSWDQKQGEGPEGPEGPEGSGS